MSVRSSSLASRARATLRRWPCSERTAGPTPGCACRGRWTTRARVHLQPPRSMKISAYTSGAARIGQSVFGRPTMRRGGRACGRGSARIAGGAVDATGGNTMRTRVGAVRCRRRNATMTPPRRAAKELDRKFPLFVHGSGRGARPTRAPAEACRRREWGCARMRRPSTTRTRRTLLSLRAQNARVQRRSRVRAAATAAGRARPSRVHPSRTLTSRRGCLPSGAVLSLRERHTVVGCAGRRRRRAPRADADASSPQRPARGTEDR